MQIRKAERKKSKLRIGISGASGSGKTWSALELAHGIGGKVGLIDTESGRGDFYAGSKSKHDRGLDFDYDIIRLEKPFNPEKYIEAIHTFEDQGYDVLIIDSLSHAWEGQGGILDIVEKGNGWFNGGGKIATPKQHALVEAIISSKMHVIATLRAKTEYVIEMNDRGKNAPRKVGLKPVQKDGIEYEFTVFMNIDQNHNAVLTKDNTNTYDQTPVAPSPSMGKKFIDWMERGADVKDERTLFVENDLTPILEEFDYIQTLDELKKYYSGMYHKYASVYPEEFTQIEEAKNRRKEHLESQGDIIPKAVGAKGAPIIRTGTYKSALTTVSGGA